MDQDQRGKTDAKGLPEKSPVEADKCAKAQQEFQLEDGRQERLAFGQQQGNRA